MLILELATLTFPGLNWAWPEVSGTKFLSMLRSFASDKSGTSQSSVKTKIWTEKVV